MTCFSCLRGFHEECEKGKCKKCHPKETSVAVVVVTENEEGETSDVPRPKQKQRGSTYESLKDPQSAGRKRAAKLYPINSGMPCEWQGLKNCGGGLRPVVGCLDGIARDRHHGPVKKTTFNHEGNVHRICASCHQHWHELNDLIYDQAKYNLLPHEPVAASSEEIAQNWIAWKSGEIGRKYELASSKNKNFNPSKEEEEVAKD